MNKRLLSLLLAALLLAALLPAAAFAQNALIVGLGNVRAGAALDLKIATTESGTASLTLGSLPDNCTLVTEEHDGQACHYLRGTPGFAGVYEFTLEVTDTVEVIDVVEDDGEDEEEPGEGESPEPRTETVTFITVSCSITVLPAVPTVSVQDLDCFVAEDVRIKVQASADDQGTLSFQWYSNDVKDNQDGKLLEGKTERELAPDTEFVGTSYYYCVVTNTNRDMSESVTSAVITVKVTEPSITSVAISTLPNKLEYTEGDTLDTTGLTLLVHYSNGMAVTDDEGFSVSPTKLEKPGTQTITINYQNNELSFPVIVNEAKETIEGLAVTSLPTKRSYRLGEHLDTTGLVVETIGSKGTRTAVKSGYVCTPDVLNNAGLQTVTVSYEGKTTTFTVTVQAGEKTVQEIAIETLPSRLVYQVGDSFDSSGLVLRVTTDQGSETVRSGFTCTPARFTRDGVQTVTVSYGGKSCSFELTVSPAADKPAESETSDTSNKPASGEDDKRTEPDKKDGSRSGQVESPVLLIVIFAALVALVALLAYVYVTKKDAVVAFFRRPFSRGEEPGDEDEEEDEADDDEANSVKDHTRKLK